MTLGLCQKLIGVEQKCSGKEELAPWPNHCFHWGAFVFCSHPRGVPCVCFCPGLHRITVTNTWYSYGSLQHLLGSGSAVFKDAAVSDGGRR